MVERPNESASRPQSKTTADGTWIDFAGLLSEPVREGESQAPASGGGELTDSPTGDQPTKP